jgi:Lipopolysaccharide-assembly
MDRVMARSAGAFGWVVVGVMLLQLGGCGYSNKELYPTEYRTVAAPIFENRTFYRGVEFQLAEALTKQIESRTPYKVVSPGVAQTQLEGTITHIDQRQLSRRRPGGVPQEVEYTVTVDFVWKDLGRGGVIRDRRGFQAVGRYVPTAGVGEPFELGLHQVVQRMAQDIVSTMQADW